MREAFSLAAILELASAAEPMQSFFSRICVYRR